MNNLSKIKNALNKANTELSSKLLFYDTFIDINNYTVKIINHENYEEKDIDCCNKIIYIDNTMINSISLKSIFKHKLIHAYLYNMTDINLKRLSIDTSYLFILYCIATDTKAWHIGKNTIYYNNAMKIQHLIKNRPYLIDLLYINLDKQEKERINSLNKLAETEWFRVNNIEYLFDSDYKKNALNIIEPINNIIDLIYQLDSLDYNIFSSKFKQENA